MESIINACQALDISWLEPSIGNFRLVVDQEQTSSTVYRIFHYENDKGWHWSALYDKEVEDYMVRITIPLVDFVDIAFIRESLEPFIENLKSTYKQSIEKRFIHPEAGFLYEYRKKGIPQWNYDRVLPPKIGAFHRDLTPDVGLAMINGSYLIGTYVKEAQETGVVLFYNTFRDEFFGETRQQGYPGITHELDATTIEQFEHALEEHLEEVLDNL